MGIVICTSVSCAQELADGSLVRVLEDWDLGQVELHALYAVGRQAKPAARALTDFLLAELARDPLGIPVARHAHALIPGSAELNTGCASRSSVGSAQDLDGKVHHA
jgi:hypothetical protein